MKGNSVTHEQNAPGGSTPVRRRSALPREARIISGERNDLFHGFQTEPDPAPTMIAPPAGGKKKPKTQKRRRRKTSAIIIGIIGELLITFGIIVAGFIAWQLWWTTFLAKQVQNEWLDDFARLAGKSPAVAAEPMKKDPPPFTLSPKHGETFGVIHLPTMGKFATRTISQGTSNWDILDHGGYGHYETTAWPGEIGNFSVAAHRRGNGDALWFVEKINPGDPIIIETADGYYMYRVLDHELVNPDQTRVIAPDPYKAKEAEENGTQVTDTPTRRLITLTTCHPEYGAAQRWIVHGEFEYWIDRSEGMPKELIEMNEKGE
ncbi:class E sortase [Arcanobacterium phocae]|uniref:class E sortase n=1 Tax=Arcanobacterium phocae TaxID=131112 RepID=UPI001C0F1A84